jgi:hypothetical protein
MVKKNKINYAILFVVLLLIIAGIAIAIYFYPTTTTPTPGQGPILNWICSGPVNDAVKAANAQCNKRVGQEVGTANSACATSTACNTRVGQAVSSANSASAIACDSRVGQAVSSANSAYATACDSRIASALDSIHSISSISPNIGDISGGTLVNISGSNFLSNYEVFFGDIKVTPISITSTLISFITPLYTWDKVINFTIQITVKNPSNSIGKGIIFNFNKPGNPPTFTEFLPSSGVSNETIATLVTDIFDNPSDKNLEKYITFIFKIGDKSRYSMPIYSKNVSPPFLLSDNQSDYKDLIKYNPTGTISSPNNTRVFLTIIRCGVEYNSNVLEISYQTPYISYVAGDITGNNFRFDLFGGILYDGTINNTQIYAAPILEQLQSPNIIPIDEEYIDKTTLSANKITIYLPNNGQYFIDTNNSIDFHIKLKYKGVESNSKQASYLKPRIIAGDE